MLNLRALSWNNNATVTPFREYKIIADSESEGKFAVLYGSASGQPARGFATVEDAMHWAEHKHYPSDMHAYVAPTLIGDITSWFKAAKPEPTDKDRLTQIGVHFEEVNEMIDSILPPSSAKEYRSAHDLSLAYKNNRESPEIAATYFRECIHPLDLLDSLCDQIVTATGVGYMMGFDMEGALKEVIRSNNSKMVDGKFIFDENGKIDKPESYSKPNLIPYLKIKVH